MTLPALSHYIEIGVLHCVAAFSYKKRQFCFLFLHSKTAVKKWTLGSKTLFKVGVTSDFKIFFIQQLQKYFPGLKIGLKFELRDPQKGLSVFLLDSEMLENTGVAF